MIRFLLVSVNHSAKQLLLTTVSAVSANRFFGTRMKIKFRFKIMQGRSHDQKFGQMIDKMPRSTPFVDFSCFLHRFGGIG
jgi:hypothetical protein